MAQLSPSLFSYIVTYKEYSLGFEIRSFLADSDIRIESLIADSALKSIAVFSTNPPPPPSNGFQQLIGVGLKMLIRVVEKWLPPLSKYVCPFVG